MVCSDAADKAMQGYLIALVVFVALGLLWFLLLLVCEIVEQFGATESKSKSKPAQIELADARCNGGTIRSASNRTTDQDSAQTNLGVSGQSNQANSQASRGLHDQPKGQTSRSARNQSNGQGDRSAGNQSDGQGNRSAGTQSNGQGNRSAGNQPNDNGQVDRQPTDQVQTQANRDTSSQSNGSCGRQADTEWEIEISDGRRLSSESLPLPAYAPLDPRGHLNSDSTQQATEVIPADFSESNIQNNS